VTGRSALVAGKNCGVNPYGSWTGDSPGEIPAADTLLIADDAHRYGDLEQLISFVSQVDSTRPLKLIIATRPSGTALLTKRWRVANESFISRFDELPQPGQLQLSKSRKRY